MKIQQLRQLIAIIDKGNFSRASKHLGISQPALTRSIQKLEEYYGGRLLDRLPGSVVPTAYGKVVVDWARNTVASSENVKRFVGLMGDPGAGTVIVGSGPYFSDFTLAETISRLMEKHPRMRIKVRRDRWRNLEDLLINQEIDLFIGYVDEIKHPKEIAVIDLVREPVILFCRKGHPLLTADSLNLKDVFEYPVAGPPIPDALLQTVTNTPGDIPGFGEDNQQVLNVEFDSYQGVRRVVGLSDCVGGLPESSVTPFLETGKLAKLPVAIEGLYGTAGMAYLKDRTLLPAVELFIEEIRKSSA
jgi:DNA-binding transcriptional LysR family regulator